jgi:hypothetical protein
VGGESGGWGWTLDVASHYSVAEGLLGWYLTNHIMMQCLLQFCRSEREDREERYARAAR